MHSGITFNAKDLTVRYNDSFALLTESLHASGCVVALLGHNGAGKSTLIKTILGLMEPASGDISVESQYYGRLVPERHMAFCPENGAVFADISVERYLELWCRIKHHDPRYYKKAGVHYVERLDITPLLSKKGRELSKGQRRRVQAALGFMSDPRLFLFDEPFDGLDVQRTSDLMEIVEEERGSRAFLISSHRMDVMERIADCFIVLQHGRVACVGGLAEVCRCLGGDTTEDRLASTLTDAMRIHLKDMESQRL